MTITTTTTTTAATTTYDSRRRSRARTHTLTCNTHIHIYIYRRYCTRGRLRFPRWQNTNYTVPDQSIAAFQSAQETDRIWSGVTNWNESTRAPPESKCILYCVTYIFLRRVRHPVDKNASYWKAIISRHAFDNFCARARVCANSV